MTPDDLINKGIIINERTGENGRTFIVTGLQRSGTSLTAALLRHAGLFIGSEINDAVLEDEAIARTLNSRNLDALRQIIAERNATHSTWGVKYPELCDALHASQLILFDRPRVIVTFRDPVAMAVRGAISEYQEPMRTLRDVSERQAAMLAFADQLPCPSLLLSYEKALMFPSSFIEAVLGFCDLPRSPEMVARLCTLIEPNNRRYIATARRRVEGLIEGIRSGQLCGWCRMTQSAEPLTVDVLVDERAVMRVLADAFREDLLNAGIGQGRHAFFIDVTSLSARPDSVIRVVVAPHGAELPNSGKQLCEFGTAA